MNDEFLTRFRRPPPPQFAARLYERIAQPMLTQTKHPARRRAGLAAAGLLAATLSAFMLFPSARALAGGIIQQIGGYGFTQDASQVTPVQKTGAPGNARPPDMVVKSQNSVSIQSTSKGPSAPDAAGATRLAGFTVLAPSYLPAGFSSMSDWLVAPQGNGRVASRGYRGGLNNFLIINEWSAAGSAEQDYARSTIVDVTINGQPGVYLPSPTNDAGRKDALVWAENGITYSLITDSVSQADLMKVAEGLGK